MSIHSLLQRISSKQVEDLVFEEELKIIGYQFFYAIDNNELHKYCFPGDLDGNNFEKNQDGQTNFDLENDIITAYDEFFHSISASNPIFFLDEYITELIKLKELIIERVIRAPLFNYAKEFGEYLDQIASKSGNVIQDFTLFIAIATGILKNGAERFNFVIKNQYFITRKERLSKVINSELFEKMFYNSEKVPVEVIDQIFDYFTEQRQLVNRFSKRVDSEAIARMININNRLKEIPNRKVLVFFLSTSKASNHVFRKIVPLLPQVGNRPFNFHRTVEQLFLQKLLNDLSFEEKIDRLNNIHKLIQLREKSTHINKDNVTKMPEYAGLEANLEEKFKAIREKYVNTNLARKEQFEKVEKLHQALNKAAPSMNLRRLKELFQQLKEFSVQHKDEKYNLEELKIVEAAFHISQTFLAAFKKAIYLLKTGHSIRISRGMDKITGRGQHLPLVFLSSHNNQNKILDEIAELFLNQFDYVLNTSPQTQIILKLTSLASEMSDNKFSSHALEDKIVFCLYSLILPDVNPAVNNSILVEEFLLDLHSVAKENTSSIVYSDFLYILSWVLRRNTRYEEALKHTNEGIRLFPDDARFYHSRFLINACLEDTLTSKEALMQSYQSQIKDVQLARNLYENLLTNKMPLIKSNIRATLLNSEMYNYLLLLNESYYESDNIQSWLYHLRTSYLLKLKALCGSKYAEYPEFQHSEALLEKFEYEYEVDFSTRINKLRHALATLEKAIETATTLESFKMDEFFDLKSYLEKCLFELEPQSF